MFTLLGSDVIGRTVAGTHYCDACKPSEGTPFLRSEIPDMQTPECLECGRDLVTVDRVAAVADVVAALDTLGMHGRTTNTGGGCMAVEALSVFGGYLLVTDGDASLPDGVWLSVGRYRNDDDDDPALVYDGPHDPHALLTALRTL